MMRSGADNHTPGTHGLPVFGKAGLKPAAFLRRDLQGNNLAAQPFHGILIKVSGKHIRKLPPLDSLRKTRIILDFRRTENLAARSAFFHKRCTHPPAHKIEARLSARPDQPQE